MSEKQDSSAYRNIVVAPCCPPAMRKRDVWRVDQFHLLKKIGSGYASTVYLGSCRATGNQVAIKLYHKNKLSELNHFQVAREIRIHSQLDHKNIIQLWAAFEDMYGIYLVSEFASKGDVFTEVERRGGQMSEAETVRQVVHPFLLALDYLHTRSIIHRDIKPENLLFTATGILKVGDFGLSINVKEEPPVTRVGTLDYMAPEVVVCPDKHKPSDHKGLVHLHYSHLVDSWAVGVLAYELIVGRPPFDKGNKKATIQEILNSQPFMPTWMSEGSMHFIRWALTKDHAARPSVQQLAEHPWVALHLSNPMTAARRLKADSMGGAAAMGLGMFRAGSFSNAPPSIASLAVEPVVNPALASLQNRTLGHSNSMSSLDALRFRDVHLDADTGEMAAATADVVLKTKRVSDGQTANHGRPSVGAHILGGIASARNSNHGTVRTSAAGAGVLGALSRMNSMSSGAQAAAAMVAATSAASVSPTGSHGHAQGGPHTHLHPHGHSVGGYSPHLHMQHTPHGLSSPGPLNSVARITQEELRLALQSPLGRSSSFTSSSGRTPPFVSSLSPAQSPMHSPGQQLFHSSPMQQGAGGMGHSLGNGLSPPGVQRSTSFVSPNSRESGGHRPSPLQKGASVCSPQYPPLMPSPPAYAASPQDLERLREDLSSRLGFAPETVMQQMAPPGGYSSHPVSPQQGLGHQLPAPVISPPGSGSAASASRVPLPANARSALRPQPPVTPGRKPGGVSPLVPSRLSHSFTSAVSPFAGMDRMGAQIGGSPLASAPLTQGHASASGQDPSAPASPRSAVVTSAPLHSSRTSGLNSPIASAQLSFTHMLPTSASSRTPSVSTSLSQLYVQVPGSPSSLSPRTHSPLDMVSSAQDPRAPLSHAGAAASAQDAGVERHGDVGEDASSPDSSSGSSSRSPGGVLKGAKGLLGSFKKVFS